MYKISAVSYLNTKPFVFGIENSEVKNNCILELDNPAVCAEKLLEGKVDIGLIPVAVIPKMSYYEIITDYCIGAEGKVASVMLYSNVPLGEIKTIMLDYQSRTSVALSKVLAKNLWNIRPKWKNAEKGFEEKILDTTAAVIIGDRTFDLQNRFPFSYDLAEEWKKLTGLPVVFACWVSNKPLSPEFKKLLNRSLKFGVENIDKIVPELQKKYSNIDVHYYLTKNLSFTMDEGKKKGMNLFLNYLKDL